MYRQRKIKHYNKELIMKFAVMCYHFAQFSGTKTLRPDYLFLCRTNKKNIVKTRN